MDAQSKPLTLPQIRSKLREVLPELHREHRVRSLAIFGSYVRGEADSASDVDLLVTFDEPPTLLELISLELKLSEVLGRKVDLVMKSALKPQIGQLILEEAEEIICDEAS